jgi:hypothetical protein
LMIRSAAGICFRNRNMPAPGSRKAKFQNRSWTPADAGNSGTTKASGF